VFKAARLSLAAALVLATFSPRPAVAGTQAEAVACSIENLTPSVQLGAQAYYVVHLSGGFGSYSVSFAYGDGSSDYRTVTGTQTSFAHLFSATGTYAQTALASGAGSSASCGSSTSVY